MERFLGLSPARRRDERKSSPVRATSAYSGGEDAACTFDQPKRTPCVSWWYVHGGEHDQCLASRRPSEKERPGMKKEKTNGARSPREEGRWVKV